MMRVTLRALIPAVAAALALAGCSSSGGGTDAGVDPGGTGTGSPAAAATGVAPEKGVTLGGKGSACALPVTFGLAADWKPQAVEVEPGSAFAELGQQGSATMVCEIDAKPAGNIGYLRVWQGKGSGTTPRAALEDFVAGDPNASKAAYAEMRAGSLAAVEVEYTVNVELLDERKTEHAFAVSTPAGPVVVHLGGLDSQEHEEMLPAYELAKRTLELG
ncbi:MULTISPECIES: lipoprotein [Streptomyces]|uniref:Lipoprotein n=2 Tax=[Kitasatospora] papulosa TaxID=1464011 RepID=A0ABZ1K222_9ACTN|nr:MULTISPECIES: lipoprotein [Streptomyces]MDF6063001.1 lipoprotein [Streptomyces sp. JH010]WJY32013.1 lipoprotein [Streptomyces sp. P9-2B-1]WSK29915.1 lipoprotein [[Kitasatospora] papulosa]